MRDRGDLISFVLAMVAFVGVHGGEFDPIPLDCRHLLDELGEVLKTFDQCALDNSRPFEVCRQCAPSYEAAYKKFSDLIKLKTPESQKCRTLVEDGRVSLVKTSFAHIEEIWNTEGVCDDCFEPQSFNVSAKVKVFFELRDELSSCIDRTWDSNTTCTSCETEFRNLTTYFGDVLRSGNRKGHCLCLDILDAMNQTRTRWGDRCFLPRDKLDFPVILASSLSCVLTAAFYVILRVAQLPKDTELARVNTLQSVMFEDDCECAASEDEPCTCTAKQFSTINGGPVY
ncbi:osteopetrosis-associated transmembrane protein 1 [Galendromus occidentalis]|uniref:Osteopetrosis-associated transmembrane protein 1 n=1 Tax=Galendromus occidentalis TaxID=34638 RepID=A0AAJ6QLG4_9ACAR|nr:osteopetrosis-associated transmembrane protein 1 [Galendromus occidentalis]